jgi:hypothetical protein
MKNKTMKGGFMEDLSNTLSNWSNSLSESVSDLWQKTKDATASLTNSSNTSSTYSSNNFNANYGGKKTRRRKMKGGYKDYTPKNNIASNAASFSGITAKPHTYVGGKSKKAHKKTRRH